MKFLNAIFDKFCPCLTHSKPREKMEKLKSKPKKEVIRNDGTTQCDKCGKTLVGFKIESTGMKKIKLICARCKDESS